MRIFASPNLWVLLVDNAIKVKIRLIWEPHVANIEVTVIHKLQHGVCEIIEDINGNGIWFVLNLYGRMWRVWRMRRWVLLLRCSVQVATQCTKVRGCCWISCCTALAFDSVTERPERWNFQCRHHSCFPLFRISKIESLSHCLIVLFSYKIFFGNYAASEQNCVSCCGALTQ